MKIRECKIKYKLLLDALMFLTIWIVMAYNFTGNLLHELLGVVLILFFMLHIFVNRKYYFAVLKQLLHNKVRGKNKALYAVNIILLFATVVMAVSSVLISKDLFTFVSYKADNGILWSNIHIVCGVVILICVFVHILLHVTMLLSMLNRKVQKEWFARLSKVLTGCLAVIIAVAVVKMSFHHLSCIMTYRDVRPKNDENGNSNVIWQGEPATEETTNALPEKESETDEVKDDESDKDKKAEASIDDSEKDDNVPTLADYLRGLFCNGCGKHCSLLSPQCRKGVSKAQTMEIEYYNTYGKN